MKLDIPQAIEILERTPCLLDAMLRDLSDVWTRQNEGGETWSPYDVIGHLLHGENSDWIQRLEIILNEKGDKKFKPFDRFAMLHESKGKTLNQLLDEFKLIRKKNLDILRSKKLTPADFDRTGIHPAFGEVKLSQLLSTWVAHDLGHIAQISRVMAKQYDQEVGPWKAYLRILS